MGKGNFSGTSKQGNFGEAIAAAIALAKQELKTDFVKWKLERVRGENGGLAQENEVTVMIKAKAPKAKRTAKDPPKG